MHTIDLPYLNRNDLQSCCENMDAEAMQHGLYYIYIAQPLVVSDGSPTEVEFNVYMSGQPNLTFYGYAKTNTYHENFNLFSKEIAAREPNLPLHTRSTIGESIMLKDTETFWDEDGPNKTKRVTELATAHKLSVNEINANLLKKGGRVVGFQKLKWKKQSGTVEVMNKPQEQHPEVRREDPMSNLGHFSRLKPNLDIRPLVRRMYKSATESTEIPSNSYLNAQLPLASFVGEQPWFWAYSPIETISRMYYGKNLGFKIRLVFHIPGYNDNLVANIDNLAIRVYYVPQNLGILSTDKTVTRSGVNDTSFQPFSIPSSQGEVPLTASLVARDKTTKSVTYEFVIPNTSFFKFMGSPDKFRNFAASTPVSYLATQDFGAMLIQINNPNAQTASLSIETFVGLTDESRFGFHSIAPVFTVEKKAAYYLGSDTDPAAPPPATLNNYIYRGGYL